MNTKLAVVALLLTFCVVSIVAGQIQKGVNVVKRQVDKSETEAGGKLHNYILHQ